MKTSFLFSSMQVVLLSTSFFDISMKYSSHGRNSLSAAGNAIGGLGTVLLLIAGGLLIRMIVGKILALLLGTTRQEVSILDCPVYKTAFENSADDPMKLEELLLCPRLDEVQGVLQERYFEWVDEQTENVISESVFG